jgi:hypothetical protein
VEQGIERGPAEQKFPANFDARYNSLPRPGPEGLDRSAEIFRSLLAIEKSLFGHTQKQIPKSQE